MYRPARFSSIRQQESALNGILTARKEMLKEEREERHQLDAVYGNDRIYEVFNTAFTGKDVQNNLQPFKAYLEKEMNAKTSTTNLYDYVSTIQYQYGVQLNTYIQTEDGSYHSTELTDAISLDNVGTPASSGNSIVSMMTTRLDSMELWSEMLPGTNGGADFKPDIRPV